MTNLFSDMKMFWKMNDCLGVKSDTLGAKAANLAALQRVGIKVPTSIVVKPSQVKIWLENLPEFEVAIEDWRYWRESRYPASLAILQQRLLTLEPPKIWGRIVARIYNIKKTSGTQIIFRSNMNAEDQNNVSFVGSYRSIVAPSTSPEDLWKCFLQVISSAFEEASAIRVLEAGISPLDFAPGILIQPIIEAKLSGLLFTRHPNSLFEAPEEIINRSQVSDEDLEDDIVVPTSEVSPRQSEPAKMFGLVEWANGGCQDIVEGTIETKNCQFSTDPMSETPPSDLLPLWDDLRDLAFDTDSHFKGPTDIEWIWDGETLWVIQARPIASAEGIIAKITEKDHYWTRQESQERFPDPLNSLSWSSIFESLQHNLKTLGVELGIKHRKPENIALCHKGYVYTDPKFFSFPKGINIKWGHFLAPWKQSCWSIISACKNYVVRTTKGQEKDLSIALLKLDLTAATLGPIARNLKIRWRNHKNSELEQLRDFTVELGRQRQSGDFRRKIIFNIEKIQQLSKSFLKTDLLIFVVKEALFKSLRNVWKSTGLPINDFSSIFQAKENNVSLQVNEDLVKLTKALQNDPYCKNFIDQLSLAKSFDDGIECGTKLKETNTLLWHTFLFSHSHVCPSWDFSKPSWGECPSQLAPVIDSFVALGNNLTINRVDTRDPQRQIFRNKLSASESFSTLNKIFRLADQVEDLIVMDEEQHYLTGKYIQPSKILMEGAGEYLFEKGLIETKSDCFHLTLSEVLASLRGQGINWSFLIERRKSELYRNSTNIPHEIPSQDSSLISSTADLRNSQAIRQSSTPGLHRGDPVSNGIAQGILCLANSFEQAKGLKKGSILLTKTPNPALVPLYPLIGGLITGSGGQLSHGFVAAREYSIPAVSNSQYEKLEKLVGQKVHIDGSNGEITVLGNSAT